MRFSSLNRTARTIQDRDFWNISGHTITHDYKQMRRQAKAARRATKAQAKAQTLAHREARNDAKAAELAANKGHYFDHIPDAATEAIALALPPDPPLGLYVLATRRDGEWSAQTFTSGPRAYWAWMRGDAGESRLVRLYSVGVVDAFLGVQADLVCGL